MVHADHRHAALGDRVAQVPQPPRVRDVEDGSIREPRLPEHRIRHIELTTSGFIARNEPVFSRTFGLRVFLGQVVAAASWDRMYETPNDGTLSRLDFYRFHLTSNLLGGLSRHELGDAPSIGGRDGGTAPSVSVYVRDPDDNLVEFMCYGEPAVGAQ